MTGCRGVGGLSMTKVLGRSADKRKCQVIELRLMQASDMFEMPHTDLFSEYRNFLTGVDFCISELRGRPSRRPVRLEIRLPAEEMDDGGTGGASPTLNRHWATRI